eukprot:CAMPEP_0171350336 /NCGR_PEP_ID=MMETSP0878-20121228/36161_1 /TAXON_ID=67004 /ORGANISM="Thalassiosira weissflogii, Strain CCMP1336" /LENGTH=253 /DNA_ID=CAMNT_0011855241 /DNA_START=8 /DNA_END=769 /DNA_ORIENTATION=-
MTATISILALLTTLLALLASPTPCLSSTTTTTNEPKILQTTTISGRLLLPSVLTNPSPKKSHQPPVVLNSTRITLNDGTHTTYTQPDGTFHFYRVPPGVHLLDVQSRQFHFSQVKIQILPDALDSPKCIEYAFPGAPKQAISHPLELTAHASYDYFEPRQGFSLMGIFKNPMLLLMVATAGMMFWMPKMMEGLDPEQKEQMQRQMEMQQDPSKMLTQLWGDLTGTGEDDSPSAIEKKPSAKAGGKTARRGKKD